VPIDLIFNNSGRGPAFLRQILNVTTGTEMTRFGTRWA